MTRSACDIQRYDEETFLAIDRGNWASIANLPEPVWGWITDMTGLSRAEWEKVPEAAACILAGPVTCPECGRTGKITDIGDLAQATDPFSFWQQQWASFLPAIGVEAI